MLKANLSIEDEFPKQPLQDSLAVVNDLISKGIKVGIVTSSTHALAAKDLAKWGFPVDDFFLIQGSDTVSAHKPDPAVFNKAIAILAADNIQKNEILYIGDALMDYFAARDAGIDFLGVTTGLVDNKAFNATGALSYQSLTHALSQNI